MVTYQKAIGSSVSKNNYVSRSEVEEAVNIYFGDTDRIIESREKFFEKFPYGIEVIRGRYKSFDDFAKTFNIVVLKTKKAKFLAAV